MIEIGESRIKEYLLDGYKDGEKKMIQVNGKEYLIQKYQGEHQNEYLISEMKDGKVEGRCELFENGILRLSWMMKDGQRIGRISEYEKGKALFTEEWESVLGEGDHRMIENSKEGLKLVIRDKNNTMIYQGEFDEELNRHGKGLEYDENGKLKYEGYWNRDKLICILREFRGDEMIEYGNCDNVDVLNRIPLYIGGYKIIDGEFKRNGIGYLIDVKNGTAMRECVYENGEELNGMKLYNGWYVNGMNRSIRGVLNYEEARKMEGTPIEKQTKVLDTTGLFRIDFRVTDLVIASNCCNDVKSLNLSQYRWLKSIEIGSDCFKNVSIFKLDGLKDLESLKVGMRSFTQDNKSWENKSSNSLHTLNSAVQFMKSWESKSSRSFQISNCDELESIDISVFSFSDYSRFELKNLPKLTSLHIGKERYDSHNFYYSSLVVEGIILTLC